MGEREGTWRGGQPERILFCCGLQVRDAFATTAGTYQHVTNTAAVDSTKSASPNLDSIVIVKLAYIDICHLGSVDVYTPAVTAVLVVLLLCLV